MKTKFSFSIASILFVSSLFYSCHKDLDLVPNDGFFAQQVYSTPEGYKQGLSRVYSSFATTGNDGPAGAGDLPFGGDEGFSDFFRTYWQLQELPTDEAVIAWGDAGLPDLNTGNWSPNNPFIQRAFYRSSFQIVMANEFMRECAKSKLDERSIPESARGEIEFYRQEARFLRAYQYWILLDLFGTAPFVTEADPISSIPPRQANKKQLFDYVESELKDLETKLKPARTNEYGRADQAAAQALLARMYLNAETYLGAGNSKYDEAATYAKKVIDLEYSLAPDYQNIMTANNNVNPSRNEFIFTINYDGLKTKGYGGTHFLAHATVGGSMDPRMFGVNGGWAGLRAKRNLVDRFPSVGNKGDNGPDQRAMFFTFNQSIDVFDLARFGDGLGVTKYRNIGYADQGLTDSIIYRNDSIIFYKQGHTFAKDNFVTIRNAQPLDVSGTYKIGFANANSFRVRNLRPLGMSGKATTEGTVLKYVIGNDPDQAFIDIDMPLFRLAEMYLIYAECATRGAATANRGTALDYINQLRTRAYGNTSGNITDAELTTDFLLDERSRELYWEGHRRTDLIRYNRFVEGTLIWAFKGGISAGTAMPEYRKLYPVPAVVITTNPSFVQNPGY